MRFSKIFYAGIVSVAFSTATFAADLMLSDSKFPEVVQSAAKPYLEGKKILKFKTDYEPIYGFLYEIETVKDGQIMEYNFLGNGWLVEVEIAIADGIPQIVLDKLNRIAPGATFKEQERKLLSVVDETGKTVQTVWYEFDDVKSPDGSMMEVTISENGNEIYSRKMKAAK